ncbi:hypothetical protein BH10ACT7_BH10ACT7_12500 [soil metagenome]
MVALTLTGCTTPTPKADTKSRHTEAAPLFATEEEALAAAEEAYGEYVAISELIATEGGVHPERIESYVSSKWLVHEIAAFEDFAAAGKRQVGSARVFSAELQQYVDEGQGATIVMYTCADFSDVRFVDSSGVDVTPIERVEVITLVVEFQGATRDDLRISGSEPWTGNSSCVQG